MTALPPPVIIEPWPLAADLASALGTTPWTFVAASTERVEALAAEIADQLGFLLEVQVVHAHVTTPANLLTLVREQRTAPLVIDGLEALDAKAWHDIDINRSHLDRRMPAIIVLDEHRLALVVDNAPNLWSWLGSSAWRGALESETTEPQD